MRHRCAYTIRCRSSYAARYRKETICARAQALSGEKVVIVVPAVMLFATAH